MLSNQMPNHPAAGKAGMALLFTFVHHRPGLPEPGRYMRANYIVPALVLISLTACFTPRIPTSPEAQTPLPIPEATPTGTFFAVPGPVVKLRLDPDGTYIAEDIGPPEFWTMMEGNKAYLERVRFHPQRGRWTWDSETGQLSLVAETPGFRWLFEQLRFDKDNPNRLAWGKFAFFERQHE
jgi:hypothetical protein